VAELEDLSSREFVMLLLLALAVVAMGVDPKPFTDVMSNSVTELLRLAALSKIPA
jgi:NADH-quinone oxidoreductase subunit M